MRLVAIAVLGIIGILVCVGGATGPTDAAKKPETPATEHGAMDTVRNDVHKLPEPAIAGPVSLEEAMHTRRSVRQFTEQRLTVEEIGQLCWSGQGITDRASGFRTAPSAGALFPIELYVVGDNGVHHYRPREHALRRHLADDVRTALQQASLGQEVIGQAPVCMVVAAVVERTAGKYGRRAERYCMIEAGHVAQNILLQATALRLAGVPVGAFDDDAVARALKLPRGQQVLDLLPLGHPR